MGSKVIIKFLGSSSMVFVSISIFQVWMFEIFPLLIWFFWPTRVANFCSTSTWWKGVSFLRYVVMKSSNCFLTFLRKKLGSEFHISFWENPWIISISFRVWFLKLFSIFDQQGSSFREMVMCNNENLTWEFKWKRIFFVYQHVIVDNLVVGLKDVTLPIEYDTQQWCHSKYDIFCVAYAYLSLSVIVLMRSHLTLQTWFSLLFILIELI